MMDLNRRAMLRSGGMAMAGAMLAEAGLARAAPVVAGKAAADDPLAHVVPELRPAARQILDFAAKGGPFSDATLPKLRAMGGGAIPPQRADIPVTRHMAPVGQGQPDVAVYVVNAKAGASRPAILHMHGGGYILGQARYGIAGLQQLAGDLDCVVASVEYRLAPETRYRGSIDDNHAGLRWLYDQAAMLGVDRARIAVMGESAGGGHAALLAIAARDRGEVPVAFQALIYPMLDDRTGSTKRLPPFIGAIGWDAAANRYGWESFLGMAPGGAGVPAAGVPARVADLRGLPPAFIAVGGVDLFVSEDMDYARRLTESGVPTELLVVPGAFHGFDQVARDTPQAKQFTQAKLDALRRAFAPPA